MSEEPDDDRRTSADMKIKTLPIDSVVPYDRNPRVGGAAIERVAASLKAFGWRQPIVVDRDMVVVVGHQRLAAARALGWQEVPVHVAADLSPEEALAYRIADNRSGEHAEWDWNLLQEQRQQLALLDDGGVLFEAVFDDGFLQQADAMVGDAVFMPLPEQGSEPVSVGDAIVIKVRVRSIGTVREARDAIDALLKENPEWQADVV